jgi:hypothetical protein
MCPRTQNSLQERLIGMQGGQVCRRGLDDFKERTIGCKGDRGHAWAKIDEKIKKLLDDFLDFIFLKSNLLDDFIFHIFEK